MKGTNPSFVIWIYTRAGTGDRVFVFDFNMVKGKKTWKERPGNVRTRQLNKFAQKSMPTSISTGGEPIRLIGMACGEKARNLLDIRGRSSDLAQIYTISISNHVQIGLWLHMLGITFANADEKKSIEQNH